MRRSLQDWSTVVDSRARVTLGISMVLAAVVSTLEIIGAAFVVAALQLVTQDVSDPVELPLVGDIERVLPGSDRVADLRWLAVIGAVFFLCRGLLGLAQVYAVYRAAFSLSVRLTDRVVASLLARPYEWHLGQNSSELSGLAVSVCQQFTSLVFTSIVTVGSHALVVIALVSVALVAAPASTLGASAALGLVAYVTLRLTRSALLHVGRVDIEEIRRSQRLTTEAFAAVREVKVFDLGPFLRRQVQRSRQRWAVAQRRRATVVAAPRILIETAAFTTLIGLLAVRGETGTDALAGIGVLGYAVVRLLPTVNNIVTYLNTARGGQASMHTLAELLRDEDDQPPSLEEGATADRRAMRLPLEARGITYTYPDGTVVLRGIDLRLGAGTSLGLVGSTGSGKSTLLDVLIGLLPSTGGTLTVGGEPIDRHRRAWWSQIGVVPQTITLLDGTLVENIAIGVPTDAVDRAALERAIRLAQLEEVVASLPAGVDTQIGERGVRLSGGQRQRVAIARALYRDPPVIFLDEGTSALDADTERAVISALRRDRPDRTLVMVAHRISTLRDCDEILVMVDGEIAARGTHDQLMSTNELFRRLANSEPEAGSTAATGS